MLMKIKIYIETKKKNALLNTNIYYTYTAKQ